MNKLLGISLLTLSLFSMTKLSGSLSIKPLNTFEQLIKVLEVTNLQKAHAATMVCPMLDGQNPGTTAAANLAWARWAYYMIAGPATGYSISNCGPETGIIGEIKKIMDKTEKVIKSQGVTACSAVPTSGSFSATASDGSTFTVTYGVGDKTIPPDFPITGTFTKKLVIARNSVNVVNIQFTCATETQFVGNILMDTTYDGSGKVRKFETAFYRNQDSDTAGLNFAMVMTGGTQTEKVLKRFRYNQTGSKDYEVLFLRSNDDSSDSAFGLALKGSATSGTAHLSYTFNGSAFTDTTAVTSYTTASAGCISMNTGNSSTGCTAPSAPSITNFLPTATPSAWTVTGASGISISSP